MPQGLPGMTSLLYLAADPLPGVCTGSDSRTGKFIDTFGEQFEATVAQFQPKCVVAMGKWAIRQVAQRSTAIGTVRGQLRQYARFGDTPVFHTYTPANVLRVPDYLPLFQTDLGLLAAIPASGLDHGRRRRRSEL